MVNSTQTILGRLIQEQMIPVTPQGEILGKVNSNGTVENDRKQIVGRILSNGLVKNPSGSKIVARLVRGGLVVGLGCKNIGYLEKTA